MTLNLSIVVVAYNIENYIEQCLESCIFGDLDNYEVIVVYNASTDDTLKSIRRCTEKHPNIFKVIENDTNEGLGEGRNIGMEVATGDYIIFLDGDDWLSVGFPDRVLPILTKRAPDVLMYNYVRFWDTGGVTENPNVHLLRERDISDPFERAKVIPSMGVAWNRAYRRVFLLEHGLKFNRRYYEDIDWNFSVILNAETYYVIPDRLVFYRQRAGSITNKVDVRHMDMLDQYRDVFRIYEEQPSKSKPYERATYAYAKGQIFNVVLSGVRLPRNLNRPFLRQAYALLKTWRVSVGFRKTDTQLLAASTGSKALFRLVSRLRKRFKGAPVPDVRSYLRLWVYRNVFLKLPIQDNKAVFESYWGQKIDCNPEAIAACLATNGGFKVVWGLDDPGAYSWPHQHVAAKRGSLSYLYHLATAKYLVSNVNFAGYVVKRIGSKHVQTFHGTPIKAMGLDIRPIRPKEMNWRSFAMKCRKWDIGISSNEYSTAIWRRSHPYNYKIIETGYPRNDALVNGEIDVERVRTQLGIPKGKKVALYAPTFRDDDKGKPISVPKTVLDFDRMQSALGSEFTLVVRVHHLSKIPQLPKECIDASGHPSVNEVLAASDILITDYSSLMFDYAALKRPIIVYSYDYETYSKKRGFYLDIRQAAPGFVAGSLHELLLGLRTQSYVSQDNLRKLEDFHERFCKLDDGRATERVLEIVFGVNVSSTSPT